MRRRTILFMLLIWTPLTLNYEIEPINNIMLPVLKGTSFITDGHYTIHYHINITNIKSSLGQVQESIVYANNTLHEIKSSAISHIALSKLNHAIATTNNLKNLLEYYTKNVKLSPRHKRGLVNIVGTAQKWLFGTLDAEDGIKYDSYIKTLRYNQNILNKDLNSQKLILKKLTETVDSQMQIIEHNQIKILQKLKDLDLKDTSLFTTLYISLLMDNINLELSQIETTCNNLQTAINFAQVGIMHYSILKYTDLSNVLKTISKDRIIPFNNIIKYYETMHAQVNIQNDLIIFTIHIPLVSVQPFLLYKIYPIPFLNRTISIKHSYLLSSASNYFTLDKECPLIESFYLCTSKELTKEDQCLHLMINLKGQCPTIPITFKRKSVVPLSDNSLLVIPKKNQTVHLECSNQISIEIVSQPSIIFPRDCHITIDDFKFSKQNSGTIDFRFKLPTIPINISQSHDDPSIQVEQIDHSLIEQAKKDISALKIHNLPSSIDEYSFWNEYTITVILLLVISTLLLVIYFIKYYYNKKPKSIDVEIQLQDTSKISEKPTVFSET